MARKRTTVNVGDMVVVANRMLQHLAQSGTREDQVKREAIIAVTSQILLDSNAYRGFQYLNQDPPVVNGEKQWDNSRILFYG